MYSEQSAVTRPLTQKILRTSCAMGKAKHCVSSANLDSSSPPRTCQYPCHSLKEVFNSMMATTSYPMHLLVLQHLITARQIQIKTQDTMLGIQRSTSSTRPESRM